MNTIHSLSDFSCSGIAYLAKNIFLCPFSGSVSSLHPTKTDDIIRQAFRAVSNNPDELCIRDSAYMPEFRDISVTLHAPHIRFYAEYRMLLKDGHYAALYIADTRPRVSFSLRERDILKHLCRLYSDEVQQHIIFSRESSSEILM